MEKILVLKQKNLDKKYQEWVRDDINSVTKEHFEMGWLPLDRQYEFIFEDIDYQIKDYIYVGIQSEGLGWYRTDFLTHIRTQIRNGKDYSKYKAVFFIYENTFKAPKNTYVAPNAQYASLHPGTYFSEIPIHYYDQNVSNRHTPSHEMKHIECFDANDKGIVPKELSDNMDKLISDGTPYYKNSNPFYPNGNYYRTILALKPYYEAKKKTIMAVLQGIINGLLAQLSGKTGQLETEIKYPEAFEKAFATTLIFEGGYVNDPKDKGGETKYGISKKSYPKEDIKNLTIERAKEIYFKDYWNVSHCSEFPEKIAIHLFDMSVNHGSTQAIKMLQEAIGAVPDGVIGNETFSKVKDDKDTLFKLTEIRLKFYGGLSNWDYYKNGWIKRALELLDKTL